MKVYPNPSTGKYNLELPNEIANNLINIKVFTIYGESIIDTTSHSYLSIIDLSSQPSGIYILKASNTLGQVFIQRIIKH